MSKDLDLQRISRNWTKTHPEELKKLKYFLNNQYAKCSQFRYDNVVTMEVKYSIWFRFQDWLFRPGTHAWEPVKNQKGETVYRVSLNSKRRRKIFKCRDCGQTWMRGLLDTHECEVFKAMEN